jgi:Protein of unknown function (DUF3300)
MKRTIFKLQAIALGILLLGCPLMRASATASFAPDRFSDAELDELLAPIALYPDPLLAQVVPASTFIDQLESAQQTLNGSTDDNTIGNQSWDVSVKSVAHYPQILQMMVEKRDWTTALGQAYVNQSTDVGKSIQRLRAQARAAGSLATSSQQQVIVEGNVIKIVPAQPQVIYVPQYNPEVVYVNNGPSTGERIAAAAITFGAGLAIGAWLNNDWDWRGRGIYYHGWVGGGWIGANRTFVNVNVNRSFYINNRYRTVGVNRAIVNRNIGGYRTTLNRNAVVRRNNINVNNINRTNINRNNVNVNNINRNTVNRNNTNRNTVNRANNSINRTNTQPRLGSGGGGQQRTINNSSGPRKLGGGGAGTRQLGGGGTRSIGAARSGGGLRRHSRRRSQKTRKVTLIFDRGVREQAV